MSARSGSPLAAIIFLKITLVVCDLHVIVFPPQNTDGPEAYRGNVTMSNYATDAGTSRKTLLTFNCSADNCVGWTVIGWGKDERKMGDPVAVGEEVKFQLDATKNVKSKIRIGLCGSQCSVVTSWGISRGTRTQAPILGHISWISRGSDINDNALSRDLNSYTGPWSFDDEPNHTFVVLRRSELEMVVWAEIGGRRTNQVVLPLTADRDKFFVSSFVGPTKFLSDAGTTANVWRYKSSPGVLSTPTLPGVLSTPTLPGVLSTPTLPGASPLGQLLCVDVSHKSMGALLLGSFDAHGSWQALASLVSEKKEQEVLWTRNRVLIPIPQFSWRLTVSASSKSFVESISSCTFSKNDKVVIGRLLPQTPYVMPVIAGAINITSSDNFISVCENGGRKNEDNGQCMCPLGFTGSNCEKGCTSGVAGSHCHVPCTGSACRKTIICSQGLCSCAPGYRGEICEKECSLGEYGAGCTLSCGACAGGSAYCNKHTGYCDAGCEPGHLGENCKQEFIHLVEPPKVVSQNTQGGRPILTGTVDLSQHTTRGYGIPSLLDLQFKVLLPKGLQTAWQSGDIQELPSRFTEGLPNETFVLAWRLDGFPLFSSRVAIRGILKDAVLQGLDTDDIPQTVFDLTEDKESLQAVRLDPWTLIISWPNTSSLDQQHVHYKCLQLLACDAPCSHSSGRVHAEGNRVKIRGLFPGARYHVSVRQSADFQRDETVVVTGTVTTDFAAPSTVAENPRLVWVTRDEAAVEWREPANACLLDNGPRAGYHWELSDGTSGNTSLPSVILRDLKYATDYEIAVYTKGVRGWQKNPKRGPLLMSFTTSI